MFLLVATGDAQHRWWSCCWGHIFEHGPVAEGDALQCPAFFDNEEPCGTSFVFEPFASRQEALDAFKPGSPRPQWAPWAANRRCEGFSDAVRQALVVRPEVFDT
jgi:hypothetical protein